MGLTFTLQRIWSVTSAACDSPWHSLRTGSTVISVVPVASAARSLGWQIRVPSHLLPRAYRQSLQKGRVSRDTTARQTELTQAHPRPRCSLRVRVRNGAGSLHGGGQNKSWKQQHLHQRLKPGSVYWHHFLRFSFSPFFACDALPPVLFSRSAFSVNHTALHGPTRCSEIR